jgi:hypothetical protein
MVVLSDLFSHAENLAQAGDRPEVGRVHPGLAAAKRLRDLGTVQPGKAQLDHRALIGRQLA